MVQLQIQTYHRANSQHPRDAGFEEMNVELYNACTRHIQKICELYQSGQDKAFPGFDTISRTALFMGLKNVVESSCHFSSCFDNMVAITQEGVQKTESASTLLRNKLLKTILAGKGRKDGKGPVFLKHNSLSNSTNSAATGDTSDSGGGSGCGTVRSRKLRTQDCTGASDSFSMHRSGSSGTCSGTDIDDSVDIDSADNISDFDGPPSPNSSTKSSPASPTDSSLELGASSKASSKSPTKNANPSSNTKNDKTNDSILDKHDRHRQMIISEVSKLDARIFEVDGKFRECTKCMWSIVEDCVQLRKNIQIRLEQHTKKMKKQQKQIEKELHEEQEKYTKYLKEEQTKNLLTAAVKKAPWLMVGPLGFAKMTKDLYDEYTTGGKEGVTKKEEEVETNKKDLKQARETAKSVDKLIDSLADIMARYWQWWGFVHYDYESLNRSWVLLRDSVFDRIQYRVPIPSPVTSRRYKPSQSLLEKCGMGNSFNQIEDQGVSEYLESNLSFFEVECARFSETAWLFDRCRGRMM